VALNDRGKSSGIAVASEASECSNGRVMAGSRECPKARDSSQIEGGIE
jgi:hypothetical protein